MKPGTRMLLRNLSIGITLTMFACGDTGRDEVSVPVFAQGTPSRPVTIEGAQLRLTKAEVAFGPLYLCATESAESELCETALAELLNTQSCDALSAEEQPLATLEGTTGSVRSGFFDYGITWGLTQQGPRANPGSARGHSARFEGEIELDDGTRFTFEAEVDIDPLSAGDAAVNGLKTRHTLSQQTQALTVRFDPNAWLRRIKVDGILALTPNADGEVTFEPGSQPYEAIVQGMTANSPPTLLWQKD